MHGTPFIGTALGYTLTLPAFQTLLVFFALGAGMASPYLLLSGFPRAMAWVTSGGLDGNPQAGAGIRDSRKRGLAGVAGGKTRWVRRGGGGGRIWVMVGIRRMDPGALRRGARASGRTHDGGANGVRGDGFLAGWGRSGKVENDANPTPQAVSLERFGPSTLQGCALPGKTVVSVLHRRLVHHLPGERGAALPSTGGESKNVRAGRSCRQGQTGPRGTRQSARAWPPSGDQGSFYVLSDGTTEWFLPEILTEGLVTCRRSIRWIADRT
ncbi:MAG: hypothetical protein IPN71_09705 [Fibrobacteres bacterium]|nr:hypothetical protein [Fibrobacterota bacterium]